MAQDNSNIEMAENLFKAIDIITTKRLEQIKFDKTLTCQIVDASNKDKGLYVVSDGMTEFLAYSENSSYTEDTWVYVVVPNGDFDEQKIIVGKYVADNTEYATYQNPLNTYLDITGNLIDHPEDTFGLIANNVDKSEIVIWRTGQMVLAPLDSSQASATERIQQISQQLITLENNYNVALQIYKDSFGEDSAEYLTKKVQLDEIYQDKVEDLKAQKDALNVLYKDVSPTTRQLSNFDRLGIQAKFKSFLGDYDIDFGHYGLRLDIVTVDSTTTSVSNTYEYHSLSIDTDDMFGNPYNFIAWSKQQCVFDISEFNNIMGMQLVFYQNNDFVNEYGELIPGYPSLEDDSSDENKIQWQAYNAMNNILVSDIFISLGYDLHNFNDNALLLFTFDPLTYSSYLTAETKAELSRKYPQLDFNTEEDTQEGLRLVNEKNLQIRWIRRDIEQDTINAFDDPDDIDFWETSEIIEDEEILVDKPIDVVHWYHWNLTDGIKDDLAGAFWEEIKWPEDETSLVNHFQYNHFIPNPLSKEERIKVIIESPSREYLRAKYNDTVDNYITTNTEAWKKAIIEETCPDGHDEDNEVENALIEVALYAKIETEKDNYLTSCLAECQLYESAELIFTNEQEVVNQANLDLIEALQLVVDNDPNYGLHGTYYVYNSDGQIINSNDATRTRIITASFNTLITGNDEFDEAIQSIRWYFPVNQTMIEYPALGCEYETLPDELKGEIELSEEDKNNLSPEEQEAQLELLKATRELALESYRLDDPIFAESAGLTSDGEWFCIERQGIYSNDDRQPGDIVPTQTEQIFRIKPYFTQTAINNTIKCEIYKNNKTYKAECTLYFGTSGSNGTDYTFTTTFEQEVIRTLENGETKSEWVPMSAPALDWHGERVKLVPHVFNYNNIEVTDQYRHLFEYSLYSGPSLLEEEQAFAGLSVGTDNLDDKNNLIITCNKEVINKLNFLHYIIKVTAHNAIEVVNEKNTGEGVDPALYVSLTTYCPIAIRFDDTYIGMDGDSRITYDSSGANPIYYKDQYKLYKLNENNVPQPATDIEWYILLEDSDEIGEDYTAVQKYYPRITTNGILTVPSIYISDNSPQVSIIAVANDDIVWCQPLYISQQLYASNFLNSWDGSLIIDDGQGTIMSTMMGAGYKDESNLFNGILMGKVAIDEYTDTTGLFGYQANEQSFGFRVDGTAFLGRRGTGQIIFDGTQGVIQSSDFTTVNGIVTNGVRLDLGQGSIFAASGYIGGWKIDGNCLRSDTAGGIVLHSPLADDAQQTNPLRISVGELETTATYWIADIDATNGLLREGDEPVRGYNPPEDRTMILNYNLRVEEQTIQGDEQQETINNEEVIDTIDTMEGAPRTVTYRQIFDNESNNGKTAAERYEELIHTYVGYITLTYSTTDKTVFRVRKSGLLEANQCSFPRANIDSATIGQLNVTKINNIAYKHYSTVVVTSAYKTSGKLKVIRKTIKYLGLAPTTYSEKYYTF